MERTLSDYEQLFSQIVPVDKGVALAAFRIICQTPQLLPLVDALIVGAAHSQGASLVHRNQHMRPIPRRCLPQWDLDSADHHTNGSAGSSPPPAAPR